MIKLTSIVLLASLFASPALAHAPYKDQGFYNGHNNYVTGSPLISNFIGSVVKSFSGMVSYYGAGEKLNRYASDGSVFNPNAMTAAHRTLPFGTKLKIMYGNRAVIVRVTDRGPGIKSRVLDLSYGAAKVLGIVQRGTANVKVAILN